MKLTNLGFLMAGVSSLLCVLPSGALDLAYITDNTCTAVASGEICASAGDDGCTSTTFYVEVSGTYTLEASTSISCTGGNTCNGCQTEAYIYETDNPPTFVNCVHSLTCCAVGSQDVDLRSGLTYILYCCKVQCSGADCSGCNSNCVSRARVYS